MATPGWYPDPSGQPQMFRYWDGQSWSEQLTSDPSSPPPESAGPPPAAPPTQVAPGGYPQQQYDPYRQGQPVPPGQQPYGAQPGQPGQPQPGQPQPGQYGAGGYGGGYPATPGGPGGPTGGAGRRIALIAVAVLVLVGLALGGFFGVRALTGDDDNGSASDESSDSPAPTEESESPTDETESPSQSSTEESPSPTETTPAGDPCTGGSPGDGGEVSGDGSISGGDLTLPPVRGYRPLELQAVTTFTFADEVAAVYRPIEESWIALYSVGGLPRANGYTDLAASVDQVITCMTGSPNFYRGFSSRDDLEREAIQVDGHDAYSVTTEIRVDDPDVQVDGDRAKVIVVDTGDEEHLGLYVSVVPIGDQALIDQQEAISGRLKVDD